MASDRPTVDELLEMLARCEEATRAPWGKRRHDDGSGSDWWSIVKAVSTPQALCVTGMQVARVMRSGDLGASDAAFIAHARTDLPRVVRALLEMIDTPVERREEGHILRPIEAPAVADDVSDEYDDELRLPPSPEEVARLRRIEEQHSHCHLTWRREVPDRPGVWLCFLGDTEDHCISVQHLVRVDGPWERGALWYGPLPLPDARLLGPLPGEPREGQ